VKSKIRKTIPWVLNIVLYLVNLENGFAQENNLLMSLQDPLKYPEIWKKLQQNPIDSVLWVDYFGKNWKDFSTEETQNQQEWEQILILHWIVEYRPYLTNVSQQYPLNEDYFSTIRQIIHNELKNKALNQIDIADLRLDIEGNFLLIEDCYKQLSLQLNKKYKYYHEVYPNKEINTTEWVKLQDEKFRQLKQEQFKKIYQQYIKSQSSDN